MERKRIGIISLLVLMIWLAGCGITEKKQEEHPVDYTVMSEDRLPEELKKLIEEKGGEPFKMTYREEGYLYVCQGFGKHPYSGYSIQVEKVTRGNNAIYFSTLLLGPQPDELKKKTASYPYIVIKMQDMDMTVVFE